MRGFSGTLRYVSKYVAKTGEFPSGWKGRAWGLVGRKHIPWATVVVIRVQDNDYAKVIRIGRKMIAAKGKKQFFEGLTWIMNGERMLDYLEWLESQGGDEPGKPPENLAPI
jgi:hypothetical protein